MARRRGGLGGLNLGVSAVTHATRAVPHHQWATAGTRSPARAATRTVRHVAHQWAKAPPRAPIVRPVGRVGPRRRPVRRAPARGSRHVPSVFHQRIGTVGPTGPQGQRRRRQAARRVERAVHRTPGHARPPIVPKLPRYSPAARRDINRRIQRYGRALARERGYSSPGAALRHGVDLRRQVPALRTAEARRQYAQTPQAQTLARIGRRAVLAEARRNGIAAVLGIPQSGRGPYGTGQLRSQRPTKAELHALRRALRHAPQGSQIKLGRLLARARSGHTYNAADSGYKKTPLLSKAAAFAFDPRRNAFVAAYEGLNQNSPQFRDLFGLPANAVTSTYNIAAGLFEAADGRPQRLKQLASSFAHHDPLALLVQGKFKQAGSAALNAPFSTALEVSGLGHGVARLGEGAVRASGRSLSRGLEVKLPRTDIGGFRSHSNHAAVRVAQRAWIARNIRRSDQLRADSMKYIADHPEHARELQKEAARIDPRVHVAREVRRRMDERVAANEDVRRAARDQIMVEAHRARAKKNGTIQVLLNHGIVHADKADIEAYLHELEAEYPHLVSKSKRIANRELRDSIEKALADPKLDLPHLAAKAREFAALMEPRQAEVVAAELGLAADQAERAKVIGYAVRRMHAYHDGDALVDGSGNMLTTAQIHAHMADPTVGGGVQDPSLLTYLPQRPGARSAGNFFRNFADPSQSLVRTHTRTGEAVRQGLFDAHPDILIEHAANVEGLLAADRGFRQFYREFGIHDAEGRHVTRNSYDDIVRVKREAEAATGRRLRPIRLQPWRGDRLERFLEDVVPQDAQGFHPEPINDALLSAINTGADKGPGPWGLIDETAAKRLTAHLKVAGPDGVGRAAQVVNQAFRRTVLPFSVKWLTGNVVEAGLRYALLEHFNPVTAVADWRFGQKVLKAFDAQVDSDVSAGRITAGEARAQKAELRGRAVGGGHYAMNVRTMIHRSAEQFQGEAFHNVARVLGAFWRAPGPKTAAAAFRAYTNWMMNTVNGTVERRFQAAMLGREARVNLLPSNMPTVAAHAAEDAAKGLRGTNAQVRFGRMVDEAYGRYDKFSPTTRRAIGSVTPFVAWTLNSIRFISHTLPADHPVVTALLAAGQHASQDWLLANGLYQGGKDSGALPSFLQGSIPTGGGHINASRYTPFGLFQDTAGALPNLIFPQYSGAFEALQGKDWKGDPLKGVDTDWQKFGAAIQAFAESTVPIYSQWAQYHDRKGTVKQRLLAQFWPFYPVSDRASNGNTPRKPLLPRGHDGAIDRALGDQADPSDPRLYDQAIDKALSK